MTRYRANLETTVVVSRAVEIEAKDEQEAHDRLWTLAAASGPDLRRDDWRIERAVDDFVAVSGLQPVVRAFQPTETDGARGREPARRGGGGRRAPRTSRGAQLFDRASSRGIESGQP